MIFMKLYNVPRETYVRVLDDIGTPVGSEPILRGDIIFFDHLDGMYSFCFNKEKTHVIHLSTMSEVEIVADKDVDII